MAGPISDAALAYVRQKATAVMQATCKIERVTKPTFNQSTGTANPGSKSTIYQGPCRIWALANAQIMMLGEDEVSTPTTQLSIPWDVATVPKRNDEVQITAHNTDSTLVGERFKINSTQKAGELRATRTFVIVGYDR